MVGSSIRINFIYNAVYQILLILTPIVTTPYVARVLGSGNVGIWSYSYSFAGYFVLIGSLALSSYGPRVIATGRDSGSVSKRFWEVYTCQVVVAGLTALVYVGLCFFYSDPHVPRVVYLIWMPYVFSTLFDVSWLFFGLEEFKTTTIRSIGMKLLEVFCIFALVREENGLVVYTAIISTGFLINQMVLWLMLYRRVSWRKPTLRAALSHLRPNITLFIPIIGASVYTLMNKLLLGAISGMNQVAYYEYAEKLTKIPLALLTALSVVVLPRMAHLVNLGYHNQVAKLLARSTYFTVICGMAIAVAICSLSSQFIPLFLGDGYEGCITLTQWFSITILLIGVSNVYGRQFMIPAKMDFKFTVSILAGALVNIVVNLIFVPRFDAMASVCGSIIAELVVVALQIYFVKSKIDIRPLANAFLIALPAGIAMWGVVYATKLLLAYVGFSWGVYGMLLQAILGSLSYVCVVLVFCVLKRKKVVNDIGKCLRILGLS